MRREGQVLTALPGPALRWEADGTPRSATFDDIYYSPEDGAAESEAVFLAGNRLPGRWREAPWAQHASQRFVIAETGFGTGLNFLLTWLRWRECPGAPRLHYLSVERYPLAREALSRALSRWPALAVLAEQLLAQYPPPLPGVHRLLLDEGQVILDLWWGDADACLADWERSRQPRVDAWYLDGFAPARNADLWRDSLFQRMARLSRPGASLATFTAAGAVRRGLQAAGFAVEKRPGHGRKRERIVAHCPATAPPLPWEDTPWEQAEQTAPPGREAVVIGAGLAGSHCAAALARRGFAVTVLESGAIAGAASGNAQGILYTRLSHRHSALVDFALGSFGFASRLYRQLFESGHLRRGVDGELCGSLQLLAPDANPSAPGAIAGLFATLDKDAASDIAGLPLPIPASHFPQSGWLSPAAVCRALLSSPDIEVREGLGPVSLSRQGDSWRLLDGDGEVLADSQCVIVAAGLSCTGFPGLEWLPLKAVRGQTTQLPPLPALQGLRSVICHDGYIAPAAADGHCIGATFGVGDADPALRAADQRANLQALGEALPVLGPALAALDPEQLPGRVGWRGATPDYLPLAGPVADLPAFVERYAALRSNARRRVPEAAPCLPGLYLSAGHGSRGLTSTPLAAELIASQICAEPLPLEPELQRALSPNRFLVRKLARNQC